MDRLVLAASSFLVQVVVSVVVASASVRLVAFVEDVEEVRASFDLVVDAVEASDCVAASVQADVEVEADQADVEVEADRDAVVVASGQVDRAVEAFGRVDRAVEASVQVDRAVEASDLDVALDQDVIEVASTLEASRRVERSCWVERSCLDDALACLEVVDQAVVVVAALVEVPVAFLEVEAEQAVIPVKRMRK